MHQTQPTLLFFHGLNTYGDDLLHLGPVNLGRMDRYLVPEFEKHGVRFISINGIGDDTPEAQADIALKQIARISMHDGPVHLLGNSLGGLVARVIATRMPVASVLSWGSPHLGAGAADLALNFPGKYPQLTEALAKIGYVVGKNRDVYRHYSAEGLEDFNRRYPFQKSTPEHSFVCSVPLRDVSPYFWPFYAPLHGLGPVEFAKHIAGKAQTVPDSDGFITVASQSRGQIHGPYHLDHFVQAGFVSMMPTRSQRDRARQEFEKLCSDMAALVLSKFPTGPR
jgi:pimeloyl-ACP methyl ester carboxylesterase